MTIQRPDGAYIPDSARSQQPIKIQNPQTKDILSKEIATATSNTLEPKLSIPINPPRHHFELITIQKGKPGIDQLPCGPDCSPYAYCGPTDCGPKNCGPNTCSPFGNG